MTDKEPTIELEPQFSSDNATATPWAKGREMLEKADIYWLTTVRPDARPHVTPLIAVWLDGALYFCTGPEERKARNLASNSHCVITTGCNAFKGLDLVVEGDADLINDETTLRRLADKYAAKYDWHFDVRDGAFYGDGGKAHVYQVRPAKAFGFGKGEPFSQTRYLWRR
jgi:general stress protein 26